MLYSPRTSSTQHCPARSNAGVVPWYTLQPMLSISSSDSSVATSTVGARKRARKLFDLPYYATHAGEEMPPQNSSSSLYGEVRSTVLTCCWPPPSVHSPSSIATSSAPALLSPREWLHTLPEARDPVAARRLLQHSSAALYRVVLARLLAAQASYRQLFLPCWDLSRYLPYQV